MQRTRRLIENLRERFARCSKFQMHAAAFQSWLCRGALLGHTDPRRGCYALIIEVR
jgi:hypothetical protein